MEWSNETIAEFLILCEGEPALWNSKSTEHKNKNDQHDAWLRIQKNLKGGTIPLKEIKKKKESLMGTYRKLRSKVSQSVKSGSGADDIYKPDWPFYSVMAQFLDEVYYPRKTKNSEVTDDIEKLEEDSSEINASEDSKQDDEKVVQFKRPKTLPKRAKNNDIETKMNEAYDYLKQVSQNHQTPQDECSLYTQLLCKKLRGLQENTREIAMLEIDRLVFNLKQKELMTNPHAQVQINQPQPMNLGHSGNLLYRYPLQQVQSYNSTPSQPSTSYHPSPSSRPSPSYHPYPSPQLSPNYHPSPSSQPSPNYHPSPSSQPSPSYHSSSPQPSPNYHPSPSSQPSPNYHPSPSLQPSPSYHSSSPQPSPNYHPSPSSQPSPNYYPSPSSQPSPNYHPSPSSQPSPSYHSSSQPSPNYHPSLAPQPSTFYHPSLSPELLPNDHTTFSPQQSPNSPSPQLLQDETLLATKSLLTVFYEEEGGNFD